MAGAGRKRKLAPWEQERKELREKYEQARKRQATKKRNRAARPLKDYASFCCPNCKENLRINLIRLRPDFFECRSCRETFEKEGILDDIDMDPYEL